MKPLPVLLSCSVWITLTCPSPLLSQGSRADYERANHFRETTRDKVLNERVRPHWLESGARFWYRSERTDGHRYLIVNATDGAKRDAFDHAKLASALSGATGESIDASDLPMDSIEFGSDDAGAVKTMRFNAKDKGWKCDLETYEVSESERLDPPPEPRRRGRRRGGRRRSGSPAPVEIKSPDGRWTAFVKDITAFYDATAEQPLNQGNDTDQLLGKALACISHSGASKKPPTLA